MRRHLPKLAVLLGTVGLVPFIVFGLAEMRVAVPAHAARMLAMLMAYGAVVLGFLGGVHWGLALGDAAAATGAVEPAPPTGALSTARRRLLLGALPPLIGWLALVVATVTWRDLGPNLGLAVLIGGYIATAVVEHQGYRAGTVPGGYMWLRWGLSIVVVALLVTVLVLRLLNIRATSL
jgi:uncharacterized protein DUF3429